MERNVDALVLAAINTCWRERITMPTLLHLIQTQEPPGDWRGPVDQLSMEVPVSALERWAARHHIAPTQLAAYYQRFIVTRGDRNPDLEAWLYGESMRATKHFSDSCRTVRRASSERHSDLAVWFRVSAFCQV